MGLIIQDIIIPESSATCSEWISYFNKLKEKFGKDNARVIWLKTWSVNGSASCATKPEFNQFCQKNQIDVSNIATKAIADISHLGSSILGMGVNVTKIISVGVPVALGIVVLTILFLLVKTASNVSLKDVASLTPAGRVASILK